MALPVYLKNLPEGVRIAIKVQPRASRNAVGEVLGEELRVFVTAPPVDAAANAALIKFLSEQLGCSRGQVQITRGQKSRHKVLVIVGIPPEEIAARLTSP